MRRVSSIESTRSGVAHSFFSPRVDEVVTETRAMSTGRSKMVARRAVMLMVETTVTIAERSRGVCQVNVVIMAAIRQRATATAYVTQIRLVWTRPSTAIMMAVVRHWVRTL